MQHGMCFGFTYRCFNSVWWFGGFQCGVVHVPNPPRSECFWCRTRSLRLGCMTWIARRGRAVGCRLQAAGCIRTPKHPKPMVSDGLCITFIFPMNICTFVQFWDLSQFWTNPLDSCVELCVKMPGMAWFCARLAQGRGYERKCLGRGSGRPNKADRRANNLMATTVVLDHWDPQGLETGSHCCMRFEVFLQIRGNMFAIFEDKEALVIGHSLTVLLCSLCCRLALVSLQCFVWFGSTN